DGDASQNDAVVIRRLGHARFCAFGSGHGIELAGLPNSLPCSWPSAECDCCFYETSFAGLLSLRGRQPRALEGAGAGRAKAVWALNASSGCLRLGWGQTCTDGLAPGLVKNWLTPSPVLTPGE